MEYRTAESPPYHTRSRSLPAIVVASLAHSLTHARTHSQKHSNIKAGVIVFSFSSSSSHPSSAKRLHPSSETLLQVSTNTLVVATTVITATGPCCHQRCLPPIHPPIPPSTTHTTAFVVHPRGTTRACRFDVGSHFPLSVWFVSHASTQETVLSDLDGLGLVVRIHVRRREIPPAPPTWPTFLPPPLFAPL